MSNSILIAAPVCKASRMIQNFRDFMENVDTMLTPQEAHDCKDKLENTTKQAYHIETRREHGLDGGWYSVVVKGLDSHCRENAVYDALFGFDNELGAKECAKSLSIITEGKKYTTGLFQKNFIFRDYWQVIPQQEKK